LRSKREKCIFFFSTKHHIFSFFSITAMTLKKNPHLEKKLCIRQRKYFIRNHVYFWVIVHIELILLRQIIILNYWFTFFFPIFFLLQIQKVCKTIGTLVKCTCLNINQIFAFFFPTGFYIQDYKKWVYVREVHQMRSIFIKRILIPFHGFLFFL